MSRQGRVPHDAFDGEEKVAEKKLESKEPPAGVDEEEDLDPTYSANDTSKD
jgi:hypothetical protein